MNETVGSNSLACASCANAMRLLSTAIDAAVRIAENIAKGVSLQVDALDRELCMLGDGMLDVYGFPRCETKCWIGGRVGWRQCKRWTKP